LFNRSINKMNAKATWLGLGIKGKMMVRDLWRQKDLGIQSEKIESEIPPHGVLLVKLIPVNK